MHSMRDRASGDAAAEGVVTGSADAARAASAPPVAILADDLIWATRLGEFVAAASGGPLVCRDVAGLERALADPRVRAVLIDGTARRYDPIAAVRAAVAGGRRVLVVAQHDDAELRRAALEAGASRVVPYRKMAADGGRIVAEWLIETAAATGDALP